MSDRFFLDTNVFIYAIVATPAAKARRAERLIQEALSSGHGVISLQVVQECLNVVTGKAAQVLEVGQARRVFKGILEPLCQIFPASCRVHEAALDLEERYRFHFYDCLIIAAALEARCTVLYSEDLQHGQRIGDLRIENPFA